MLVGLRLRLVRLSFLDRSYAIQFAMHSPDGSLKGKISFLRILVEDRRSEIASTSFNGQGEFDVTPPEGEDSLSIEEDNSCLLLVLNWLTSDISS